MKSLIIRLLTRLLLHDFVVSQKQLSIGEYDSVMNDLSGNQSLRKYLSILVANLIRRRMYVDEDEGKWYAGQVSGFLKLLRDAEKWEVSKENPPPPPEDISTSEKT